MLSESLEMLGPWLPLPPAVAILLQPRPHDKQLVSGSTAFVVHGLPGQEVVGTYLTPHDELIRLMSDADPESFTFRYPVDRQGTKAKRPLYIDFSARERVCEEFETYVMAIVETLKGAVS